MSVSIKKDLFEGLSPILNTSRICGQIAITFKTTGKKVILLRSTKFVVYDIILVFLIVSALIWGEAKSAEFPSIEELRRKSTITRYTETMQDAFISMIVVTRIGLAFWKIKSFNNLLRTLDDIDSCLPQKAHSSVDIKLKSTIVISALSIYSMFTFAYSSYSWNILSRGQVSFLGHLMCNISRYFLEYYMTLMQLFYSHMVYMIVQRLKRMNSNLQMSKSPKSGVIKTTDFVMYSAHIEDQPHNVAKLKDSPAEGVSVSIEVHKKICSAIHHVNETFGFSLLNKLHVIRYLLKKKSKQINNRCKALVVSLIKYFEQERDNNGPLLPLTAVREMMVIMYVFYLVVTPHHLYSKFRESNTYVAVICETLWLISHIIKILLLVDVSGRCSDEIDKTIYIVRQHLSTELTDKLRFKYDTLLRQIRQCPAEFTIMGISTIDRELLASVTSVVTTYLVILFQLKTN